MPNQTLPLRILFMKYITCSILTILLAIISIEAHAQPGAEMEVEKPEKYENRKLGAEKTGEKKFKIPRRIMQNTITHYNYYFNANNRLNDVLVKAKASFQDDYSQLLPFYNYTLEATAQDKTELDSIIYKATAGILLHDLRNDWIDNMYLILAKAYFFRNDLDSAGQTLQYINFAFAPKEEGGYDIPIGSNASNEKAEFSIASKENKGLKKLVTHQPSRNESFLWQIRTFVEKDELPEAAGIIEILRNDPYFPKRLDTELNENVAFWFYKQKIYDSAALYLSKSLNEAENGQEKARWEYLIAQMYQLANNNELAVDFYDKAIRHTNDPVMDVYARLNSIRITKTDKKDFLQHNIDELLKMARKDKYENYRDIIYFAAASIELQRDNYKNAQELLLKSVKYTTNNPLQRNQSFLLLADMNYNRKDYSAASNFYDSIDVATLKVDEEKDRVTLRKPPLKTIAENAAIVATNDSLQALANLPAEVRDARLRKMVKQARKAQGLKEDDVASSNPAIQPKTIDLFGDSNKSNDFYFYNAGQKAAGFSEFRSRWGDRPNVDNWRRQAAVNKRSFAGASDVDNVKKDADTSSAGGSKEMTFESLLESLPTTPEKKQASDEKTMNALYANAQTLTNKLEDFPSAIQVYKELLNRFPSTKYREEALFNLVYLSEKTGDKAKAETYKRELLQSPASNTWVKQMKTPAKTNADPAKTAATKTYEDIYNLFIEGRFADALAQKKLADSSYGQSFWTPQLLFIESIYYVKQHEDSTAIKVLTDLTRLHNTNPLAERAKTMIDVLKRRGEIEKYLTELPSSAPNNILVKDTSAVVKANVPQSQPPAKPVVKANDAPVKNNPTINKIDTTAAPKNIQPVIFSIKPEEPHYVTILMDKVDEVYANEARNAFNRFNREKYYNQTISISSVKLDDRYNLVLEGPFNNAAAAIEYIEQVKPLAGSRILPWLAANKYSFTIISAANLDLLKTNKEVNNYQQAVKQAFPDKF
jgi:hypothetical protein